VEEKTKLARAARRGTAIVLGMIATWAAAALGIALATDIFGAANDPAPVAVPSPVPVSVPVTIPAAEPAREATAPPTDDAGIEDKADIRAIRRAVKVFCESAARLERRYYAENPKATKARACRDIRHQLRHRRRLDGDPPTVEDDDGPLTVSFEDKRDFLTYWEVSLRHDGASWSVTSVDYAEDCTGP
jgi:hypothetical protein